MNPGIPRPFSGQSTPGTRAHAPPPLVSPDFQVGKFPILRDLRECGSPVQGTQFVILQQNFNGIRRVQMSTIDMAALMSGTVTADRAVANSATTGN